MNIVIEYIKYRWKAKGRHGIHSPFVYEFVDKCLKTPLSDDFITTRNQLYKVLASNHRVIQVDDHGAGSKSLNTARKISSIFKTSSSRGPYGILLYRICSYYRPQKILELGTSLGIGSIHMAAASPISEIITVEACNETLRVALTNFKSLQLTNISALHSTFHEYIPKNQNHFDLLFIDGHHDGAALLEYIDGLYESINEDAFLIIDDIRWSDSMYHAWMTLINDERFNLSMDLFRMGILMKKPGQAKEHFVIKM